MPNTVALAAAFLIAADYLMPRTLPTRIEQLETSAGQHLPTVYVLDLTGQAGPAPAPIPGRVIRDWTGKRQQPQPRTTTTQGA